MADTLPLLTALNTFSVGGLTDFIVEGGLWIIVLTVFIECAFFAGFFLPGDSMLFLAGFLSGQGEHNIVFTMAMIFIAAVAGNVVGYQIGASAGPKLFRKEDGLFFQKAHILRAQKFYEKHGGKTLILARFVPILRTFAPLVAGIGTMSFRRFFFYSTIGALLWAGLVPLSGYYVYKVVGHAIDIGPYMEAIFVLVILASVGVSFYHAWREKRRSGREISARELEKEQSAAEENLDS